MERRSERGRLYQKRQMCLIETAGRFVCVGKARGAARCCETVRCRPPTIRALLGGETGDDLPQPLAIQLFPASGLRQPREPARSLSMLRLAASTSHRAGISYVAPHLRRSRRPTTCRGGTTPKHENASPTPTTSNPFCTALGETADLCWTRQFNRKRRGAVRRIPGTPRVGEAGHRGRKRTLARAEVQTGREESPPAGATRAPASRRPVFTYAIDHLRLSSARAEGVAVSRSVMLLHSGAVVGPGRLQPRPRKKLRLRYDKPMRGVVPRIARIRVESRGRRPR